MFDDRAVVDDDDAVGQQERVQRVVGDQDHGSVREHAAQGLPQGRGDGDVEGSHRLVQEQQLRVRGEGARDRGSLGLSPGELTRLPVRQGFDADLTEPVLGRLAGGMSAGAGASGAEGDVVEDAQVGEEKGLLGQQRDVAVVRGHVQVAFGAAGAGEGAAVEHDSAAVGSQQSGGDGEDGGLPGSVGAEEGYRLTVSDVERDVDTAVGDGGVVLEAHRLLRPCRANPMTRIATTTSIRERATAAWASVSRRRSPAAGCG